VNDLALRVAEMCTGAKGVVVTRDAYHGNTATATAISPSLGGATLASVPTCASSDPPDTHRVSADEVAARFTADVAQAADDLVAAGYGVSCLIVDTIFSSDGIFADPVLGAAVDKVRTPRRSVHRRRVQPGFARNRVVDVGLRQARCGP
jgi:4-aminobutyrate aminotransferase-like enzyme